MKFVKIDNLLLLEILSNCVNQTKIILIVD